MRRATAVRARPLRGHISSDERISAAPVREGGDPTARSPTKQRVGVRGRRWIRLHFGIHAAYHEGIAKQPRHGQPQCRSGGCDVWASHRLQLSCRASTPPGRSSVRNRLIATCASGTNSITKRLTMASNSSLSAKVIRSAVPIPAPTHASGQYRPMPDVSADGDR
jgi:hypothetical protein